MADYSIQNQIIVGLTKIGLALKSHSFQDAELQGLTPTQGQILALLNAKTDLEMRLSEVADGLATTPATASEAVATLVEKGLAQKCRAADDGRAIAIALTERGRRKAKQVSNWSEFLRSAIDGLSLEEQEVFFRYLLKLIQLLQEKQQIPVSKMCVTCRFFQPNTYPDPQRPHHCGYVDAPFGDHDLRLECLDHSEI